MNNAPIFRVSIDLGSTTTRVLAGYGAPPQLTTLPTAFARGATKGSYVIGKNLLGRRAAGELTWPLDRGLLASDEDCLTFLRILRRWVAGDRGEVWAVVTTPASGKAEDPERLARLAGIAFNRALVVPGLTLAAFTIANERAPFPKKAMVVDLGASCVQIGAIEGRWPEPDEILHLRAGGALLDASLAESLRSHFPGVAITALAARGLKETSARATEGPATCLVQVNHDRQRRIVDVGRPIHDCVARFLGSVAEAIAHVLGDPGGKRALTHGRELILIGGGAKLPGIEAALGGLLRSRGYALERITVPEDPAELTVQGGWRVATMVNHAHWEVLA